MSHIYSCSSLPIMLSIWTGAFINPKLKLWLGSPLLLLGSWLLSPWVMSNSFVAPWAVACQAPLSMRFPRKEYWSGFLSPYGIVPTKGLNPRLLHCRQILYSWATRKAHSPLLQWCISSKLGNHCPPIIFDLIW